MRILVVGSGGREHALCWAIASSPLCDALFCAPGNAGIAQEATCVPVAAEDIDGLCALCRDQAIDFVVVGPEKPLVAGLVDRLEEAGVMAFGPSARAAILEGSKGFMKDLCAEHGIPSAAHGRFTEAAAAKAFIRARGAPIVVKADGLAAGKGVVVAESEAEACAAVDEMMVAGRFGAAGHEVVIEEVLVGEEVSVLALSDGEALLPLASAQDHKRIGDGDRGPNTGGMGAYSPAPAVSPEMLRRIMDTIMNPTVAAMKAAGRPFKGVLYAGLMITEDGPKVLEFNVRFGDPECQPLMMRLRSDLLPALLAARDGQLRDFALRWDARAALCVVMASRGYPGPYESDTEIGGLDEASLLEDVVIFHAGTRREDDRVLATGGRVLGVTALGADIAAAQRRAYEAIALISWPEGIYRRDIGWRAIAR